MEGSRVDTGVWNESAALMQGERGNEAVARETRTKIGKRLWVECGGERRREDKKGIAQLMEMF